MKLTPEQNLLYKKLGAVLTDRRLLESPAYQREALKGLDLYPQNAWTCLTHGTIGIALRRPKSVYTSGVILFVSNKKVLVQDCCDSLGPYFDYFINICAEVIPNKNKVMSSYSTIYGTSLHKTSIKVVDNIVAAPKLYIKTGRVKGYSYI